LTTLSSRKPSTRLVIGVLALVAVVATVVMLVVATRDQSRPLTDDEAQNLAISRLTNYEAGMGRVHVQLATAGQQLTIDGLVDWKDHVGSAVIHTAGNDADSANLLAQWNLQQVAVHPGTVGAADGSFAPPQDGKWRVRDLAATGSDLDSTLVLLLNLASDRPDNPQLLAQSCAHFVRSDSVDGTDVAVVTGPASTDGSASRMTYWLDGERMKRVEALLGRATEPATIDLSDAAGAKITPIPGVVQQ
jgi:hypothetical protein